MLRFVFALGMLLGLVSGAVGQQVSPVSCSGPTAWTPALSGFTVPGTPTYTLQAGTYVRCGKEISAHFAVVTTGLGGATGALIMSLPALSPSGFPGDCYLSQYEGWTAPVGYTYIGIAVLGTSASAVLDRSGSGQATALSDVSEWAAATTLRGTCVYRAQ